MISTDSYLEVDVGKQCLLHWSAGKLIKCYPVSTAKNGCGEWMGSECTPRGWHKIRAKIGRDQPQYRVFVGRRPTGEIYDQTLDERFPQRDWILSRILWLNGLEPGKNRYGRVDSGWRYIYIHGCPDHLIQGVAASHGCIRMHNADVIELFDRIEVNYPVFIHE